MKRKWPKTLPLGTVTININYIISVKAFNVIKLSLFINKFNIQQSDKMPNLITKVITPWPGNINYPIMKNF